MCNSAAEQQEQQEQAGSYESTATKQTKKEKRDLVYALSDYKKMGPEYMSNVTFEEYLQKEQNGMNMIPSAWSEKWNLQ